MTISKDNESAHSSAARRFTLKDSVYVAAEPVTGAYIDMRAAGPRLAPLPLATLSFTLDPLARLACERLHGIPHEIVRVDA